MSAERMNVSLSAFLDKMSSIVGSTAVRSAPVGSQEDQEMADVPNDDESDEDRELGAPGSDSQQHGSVKFRDGNGIGKRCHASLFQSGMWCIVSV